MASKQISVGDTVRAEGKVIDTTDDSFHTRPQVNVAFGDGQYPRWIDADILEVVEEEKDFMGWTAKQRELYIPKPYYPSTYDRAQVLREEWEPVTLSNQSFYEIDRKNRIGGSVITLYDQPYYLNLIERGWAFTPTQALAEEIVAIRKGRWRPMVGDYVFSIWRNDFSDRFNCVWTKNHLPVESNDLYSAYFPSTQQRDRFIASHTEKAQEEKLTPEHLWTPEEQIKVYNILRNNLKLVETERDAYKAELDALKAKNLANQEKEAFIKEHIDPKQYNDELTTDPGYPGNTGQRIATVRFDGSSGSMSILCLFEHLRPFLNDYFDGRERQILHSKMLDYLDKGGIQKDPTAYSDKSGRENG